MPAPRTTLWSMDDHTRAKHEILRLYLRAWLPIMATYNGRIIYLDGFAGPGKYQGGEDGSPFIAIDTFLNHTHAQIRNTEVLFLFIEQDHNRCEYLRQLLAQRTWPPKASFDVREGNFDETLTDLLDELESQRQRIAPTFAFIDPFGYSHTPMRTIQRLMSHPRCEVLITFMYEEINRFLTADYTNKASQYDGLFGTSKWRTIAQTALTPRERRDQLHNLYQDQLKQIAGIRYIRSFCMRNKHNNIDYFLFFGTNSLKGMEKMKASMWKIDTLGTYEFSDNTDPNQLLLFSLPDYSILQRMLSDHFRGRTVSVEEVEEYVIADTPFYKFKTEALKPMEAARKIVAISIAPKRPKGTFADGKMPLRFL
ncbi:MAG: three-Cys-motif partner protein TcmP [Ktedonobacteraceae bacterium]